MQTIPINSNTWRIEDGFVRCFLLTGTQKALLIDSGASSTEARKLAEGLTQLPIELLNTHGDGDHTAGNGCFPAFYMHPNDYENCNLATKFPECKWLPVRDGDVFDLGQRKLRIIGIPGHTFGSIAILDETNRLLFSGDSVQTEHIFMFGKHRQPEAFAQSLAKLEAMMEAYDRIFPSHGAPELPKEHVRKVHSDWELVRTGQLKPHRECMFGTTIDCYDGDACGFYCNPN